MLRFGISRTRVVLACALSLVLTLGLCPVAYGDPFADDANSVNGELSNEAQNDSVNDNSSADGENATEREGSHDQGLKDEKEENSVGVEADEALSDQESANAEEDPVEDGALPLSADMEGATNSEVKAKSSIWASDYEQIEGTIVRFTLPNLDGLLGSKKADALQIKAVMSYGGVITREVKSEASLADVAAKGSCEIDFGTYGKFEVVVSYLKNKKTVHVNNPIEVGVVADRYNIAPVSATYPLTLFSLSLWDIKQDSQGNEVPTIIMLERPDAYNWDNLPSGVYAMPYLTEQEIRTVVDGAGDSFADMSVTFKNRCSAFAAYVGDLYELNPKAQFDFWFVDYYLGIAQSFIYANGIPNGQYSMTIMSDGTWSYNKYKSVYGSGDAVAKNASLAKSWNAAKQHAYSNGVVDSGYNLQQCNSAFVAVLECEENARLWLSRKDLLDCGNADFDLQTKNNARIVQMNIASMLTDLQKRGEATVTEFKSLYGFNDEYFSDAEASGKQVMLLLGTRVLNEKGFSDYAKFVQTYYGDDYAYYYKGHPGTPTNLYPDKQAQLNNLGIGDVDSSIAAELILFFYPDISVSGYGSSTFTSVDDGRMLFGFDKKSALAAGSPDYSVMDGYISPVTANSDKAIASLCEKGKSNYLVELSDKILGTVDYDFAIWNATDGNLKYYAYKANGETVLVKESQGSHGSPGSETQFAGGLCTIESGVKAGKLVDVKYGSAANKANVQIYESNETPAQRYRFVGVGDGYYKIVNVKSGLVLDVQSAGKKPGTNVWQYKYNGTDAQKWRVEGTKDGDGSYRIVSKCNGLCLDVSAARSGNGTNIQVYTANDTKAQKFYLNSLKPLLSEGVYTVKSALNTSKVLDLNGASKSNGANVQLYRSNGTKAQKLKLTYDANTGYYTCAFMCSGKVLDVKSAKTANKTNVQQYSSNGTWAQKWSIVSDGGGMFRIVSACAGKPLDVASARTADKTNIWIYQANGTKAQVWKIEKVS